MQDHRRARRHVDAVVRAMLVAGGDDMLRQRRARQIERAVRIGEDSRSLRRGDLKSRVAQPLDQDRGRSARRHPHEATLRDVEFVTKREDARRHRYD
jgi:hypothetical protein